MYAKIVLLFAIVVVVNAKTICDCYEDADTKDLWDYLKKLDSEETGLDQEQYPVVPGFLSPLVDCDCGDKKRRKRDIKPLDFDAMYQDARRTRRSVRFNSKRCPLGYARVAGFLCVQEKYLTD